MTEELSGRRQAVLNLDGGAVSGDHRAPDGAAANPLARARRQLKTISEVAYESIRDAIIAGHLTPGSRLSERQLAEELGVSATPVKEALRRLQYEGLVRIRPRRGSYVEEFAAGSIRDMTLIRASLEGIAARLAAERASEHDLQELARQLRDIQKVFAARRYDPEQLYASNTRFHDLIYASSQNSLIPHLLRSLRVVTGAIRQMALADRQEAYRGFKEHRRVYNAIRARNSELAERTMRAHVMRTLGSVVGGAAPRLRAEQIVPPRRAKR